MKVLNLDELAPEQRVLTIKNVQYPMKEMTVADFIEVTKQARQAESEEAKELSMGEQVELLVDAIQKGFPTCPKEVLMGLSLTQLTAILQFVRGEMPGGEESAEVVEDDQGN